MPLTKEQAAHLNKRIELFRASVGFAKLPTKPAAVLEAEKVIAQWEATKEEAIAAHERAANDARNLAQEAVLSGDWDTALAAVKKFETTKL